MAHARMEHHWDQTDLMTCAVLAGPRSTPPKLHTFHPFHRQEPPGVDLAMNHETAPHIYYSG